MLLHNKPKFVILAPEASKYIIKKASKLHNKTKNDESYKKSNTMYVQRSIQNPKISYKQLQIMQKDLNQVMQQMLNQLQRKQFLTQINILLKQDVHKIEQEEKNLQKIKNIENIKLMRKIQYDIEQILQKHNEEIFKINNLKIQVSAARSQRFVFSSLFKKIQYQIKILEDQYRIMIIKNQHNQSKYQQLQNQAIKKLQNAKNNHQSLNQNINTTVVSVKKLPQQQKKFNKSLKKDISNQSLRIKQKLFITTPVISTPSEQGLKSTQVFVNQIGRKKSRKKHINLQQNIKQTQINISLILKKAGFANIEDTITNYSNFEQQNSKLIKQIDQQNDMILQIQEQIDRVNFQIKHNDIYQVRQLTNLQRLPSLRRIKNTRQNYANQFEQSEQQVQNDNNIITKIMQLLQMQKTSKDNQVSYDTLKQIDHRIQNLIQQVSQKKLQKKQSQEKRSCNLTQSSQFLITKMQKYDNCDRILSKKQLVQEYYNQKNKNKKLTKIKKPNY